MAKEKGKVKAKVAAVKEKPSKTKKAKRIPKEKKATDNLKSPEKKTRGATRDVSRKDASNKRNVKWGRVALILMACSGVGYGAMHLDVEGWIARVESTASRPVSTVKIEGEFNFLSRQEVQALLMPELEGNFVDVDLREVKRSLEGNPWIDTIRIKRIWPDSIQVSIQEQKPIARWDDSGFINHEGELVEVLDNTMLHSLPVLSGERNSSRDIAKRYLDFTKILAMSDLKVTGVNVDERLSWSVVVDDVFTIVLGVESIQDKLRNFIFVYESQLKGKKLSIAKVDMRYEKGLAVGWIDDVKEQHELVTVN